MTSDDARKGYAEAVLDRSRALVPAVIRVNTQVVRRGFWPKIRRIARFVPFAEDALALWFSARDRETPASTKALLMAALAYFVVPTDMLPDWFAGLGFTDDAAVIAAAIGLAGRAIRPAHRDGRQGAHGQARRLIGRTALRMSCNVVRRTLDWLSFSGPSSARPAMYVCNCNGIRERDVRAAIDSGRPASG